MKFKVAAAFGWFGKEYREKVGSLQVLVELSDNIRGFDYSWQPFSVCGGFDAKEWIPVYVDYPKGIISPCVITWEGKQILGKASFLHFISASLPHLDCESHLLYQKLRFVEKKVIFQVDIRNERASSAFNGKENVLVGPPVHTQMVLCRKAKPGYKFE